MTASTNDQCERVALLTTELSVPRLTKMGIWVGRIYYLFILSRKHSRSTRARDERAANENVARERCGCSCWYQSILKIRCRTDKGTEYCSNLAPILFVVLLFWNRTKNVGRDGAIVHAIRKESKITKDLRLFFSSKKKMLKGGLLVFDQIREKYRKCYKCV